MVIAPLSDLFGTAEAGSADLAEASGNSVMGTPLAADEFLAFAPVTPVDPCVPLFAAVAGLAWSGKPPDFATFPGCLICALGCAAALLATPVPAAAAAGLSGTDGKRWARISEARM
jgi:hypothetical protein